MKTVSSKQAHLKARTGFSLPELLFVLLILAQIAAFSIPKILHAQASSKNRAIAKEAAAILAEAYFLHRANNVVNADTDTHTVFRNTLNYIKEDTGTVVDLIEGWGTRTCGSGGYRCYLLANGAILHAFDGNTFGGTGNLNAIHIYVDPDGKASSTKSVLFFVYYNGRLRTLESIEANTVDNGNTYQPTVGADPSWFRWD